MSDNHQEDNDDAYDPAQSQDYGDYNPESIDYEAAQDDDDADYPADEDPNEQTTYDPTSFEEPPNQPTEQQRQPSASRSPVSSRSPIASRSPTAARQTETTATNNGEPLQSPPVEEDNEPYHPMSPPSIAPVTDAPQEQPTSTSTSTSALPKSVDLQALLAGLTPARTKVASPPQARDRPTIGGPAQPPPSGNLPSPALNLPPDIMYQLSNLGSPPPQSASQFPPHQSQSMQQSGPVDIQPQDLVLTPQEEHLFEKFLQNEREVVSSARWEEFPPGSRMFIGNLPSERIGKRDIFRLFYPYGRLAQISIKQAYGFVQFYEREDCEAAIRAQQGMVLTGRKVHLEVSKPQKPKNADDRGGNKRNRSPLGRDRDRSPQGRGRGRNNREFDQRGRQASRDYSPPGRYRREDEFERRYSRSRSPPVARFPGSPRGRPEPPEVALIVKDNADRPYINFVEDLFEDRRIRTETIFVNPRMSIPDLTRQLIVDGVLAVAFLSRQLQERRKISMQTFQRNPTDPGSVKWDEYNEIEFNAAADLILAMKRGPIQPPTYPSYPAQPGLPAPAAAPPTLSAGVNPNLANIIGGMNPADLQKVLGALAQQSAPAATAPAYAGYPAQGVSVNPMGGFGQGGLQGFGGQAGSSSSAPTQQVQDIMAQLAALSKKS